MPAKGATDAPPDWRSRHTAVGRSVSLNDLHARNVGRVAKGSGLLHPRPLRPLASATSSSSMDVVARRRRAVGGGGLLAAADEGPLRRRRLRRGARPVSPRAAGADHRAERGRGARCAGADGGARAATDAAFAHVWQVSTKPSSAARFRTSLARVSSGGARRDDGNFLPSRGARRRDSRDSRDGRHGRLPEDAFPRASH